MTRIALACIVMVIAAPAVAAELSLGRLFFTPSQRASLDVARSQRTRVTVATEATQVEIAQPVPQTITYGGMVRRSDGRTTVWLNDRAVDDRKAAGGSTMIRQVRPDGAVTLEVPQSSRRVDLKVGQSVEVMSGSVGEPYRRRIPATEQKAVGAASEESSPPSTGGPEKPPQRGGSAPQAGEASTEATASREGTPAPGSPRNN